ncbi:MAG: hypothetical protein LBS20_11635 [Prevotella sp.]|jgi:hypothetical protein|nr:hypothetical protein [Prevotella sp.]
MKTYGKTSKGVISGYYVVPSARWNQKGKSGVAKNMLRNSRKKRLLRITMKRIRRQELKKELKLNLQDIELPELAKVIES